MLMIITLNLHNTYTACLFACSLLSLPPRPHTADTDVGAAFASAALSSTAQHDPLLPRFRLRWAPMAGAGTTSGGPGAAGDGGGSSTGSGVSGSGRTVNLINLLESIMKRRCICPWKLSAAAQRCMPCAASNSLALDTLSTYLLLLPPAPMNLSLCFCLPSGPAPPTSCSGQCAPV
jgi:hypothetical protein